MKYKLVEEEEEGCHACQCIRYVIKEKYSLFWIFPIWLEHESFFVKEHAIKAIKFLNKEL